ncbi:MAG: hypothetical protein JOZ52_00550 [Acidobacteria bacterium]|nr:hypothetical protein [Acidobacteriota bacterium]
MMSRAFFYCSDLSRKAAETTFGTASIGDVWLLIEYPFAWEPHAVAESALASHVKAFINQTLKSVPRSRVLFIKRDRSPESGITCFIARTRESEPFIFKFQLSSYDELTRLDIASLVAGEAGAAEVITEPLFLVCTHGRRDKCCAKFGYPLYKTLRAQTNENMWQSSHVGGDRFAANLVCLPHGLFYAHVAEESGRKVMSEYRAGRLVLEKYRGRACYSHPAQAAEYFIRTETGLTGVNALRHTRTQHVERNHWRVRFIHQPEEKIYEADVRVRMSEFQSLITCHATEEKAVPQFVLNSLREVERDS